MALVTAMDEKYVPVLVGEKGNIEYTWSNNYKEKCSQFFFQLVRTQDTTKLEYELNSMITEFKQQYSQKTSIVKNLPLLTMLYKMVGQTRDIIGGKGEYNLAFFQIWVWYKHYPELAKYAFEKCVRWDDAGNNFSFHPYGSWKDVKYFAEFVRRLRLEEQNAEKSVCSPPAQYHPLIEHAAQLILEQLTYDNEQYKKGQPISLAAKWCPREKSKFKWLYTYLATTFYSHFFETAKTSKQLNAATRKAKTCFRKMLSRLNIYLKTTQIAQCAKKWTTIDFQHGNIYYDAQKYFGFSK